MLRSMALASVALALAAFAGCSAPAADAPSGSARSAAEQSDFDRNDVLDDASMTDTKSLTEEEVQAFLERTPYEKRSVLASYRPKGKPASKIIFETADEYGLSPMVLLVRTQIEQELVSKSVATDDELARAFGCGCKGESCTGKLVGFENQARCAAATLARSLEELRGDDKTTSAGWAKHKAKQSADGVMVTPANDATAALYTYLGSVGKLGGGSPSVAGTSAFWLLWSAFTAPASSAGADAGAEPGDGEDAGFGGCRVIGGDDPCGVGSRCSRSDGLLGTCRVEACTCAAGTFCDEAAETARCVQCTKADATNCRAESEGDRCLPEGKCGCLTSADCGFDRQRVCDPFRNVCVDDPFATHDVAPSPVTSKSDAGGKALDAAAPTVEAPAPAGTPEVPKKKSSTSASERDQENGDEQDARLPSGPEAESGGCSASPYGARGGAGIALAALVACAALSRRRVVR